MPFSAMYPPMYGRPMGMDQSEESRPFLSRLMGYHPMSTGLPPQQGSYPQMGGNLPPQSYGGMGTGGNDPSHQGAYAQMGGSLPPQQMGAPLMSGNTPPQSFSPFRRPHYGTKPMMGFNPFGGGRPPSMGGY